MCIQLFYFTFKCFGDIILDIFAGVFPNVADGIVDFFSVVLSFKEVIVEIEFSGNMAAQMFGFLSKVDTSLSPDVEYF